MSYSLYRYNERQPFFYNRMSTTEAIPICSDAVCMVKKIV